MLMAIVCVDRMNVTLFCCFTTAVAFCPATPLKAGCETREKVEGLASPHHGHSRCAAGARDPRPARHVRDHAHTSVPASQRVLVGLAGVPGAGKSVLAAEIVAEIQATRGPCCVCIGMDGWHYSRAELDQFPDPQEAHRRRGAAFTFNAEVRPCSSLLAFVAWVERLRDDPMTTLHAPSFSHKEKDPVPDALTVHATSAIVLVEGLYCCLNVPPWDRAAACWDLSYVLDVPRNVARARLIRRHVEAGIAADEQSAALRGTSTS